MRCWSPTSRPCSAYFRTRDALQIGLATYVAQQCGLDVRRLADDLRDLGASAPDLQELVVSTVVGAFESWLEERELILARIELSMEAARNPALAAVLADYRDRLVALVDATLASRGKRHDGRTAEALVASSDGLLVAALQKPPAERRPFLRSMGPNVPPASTRVRIGMVSSSPFA